MTKPPEEVATDFDAFGGDELRSEDAAGARVYLVLRHGGDAARVIDLHDGAEITFGRTTEATVAIDDSKVSRRHARVFRRGGAIFVEDLQSRNGTRLDGRLVQGEARASGGDVIQVGPAEIVVAVVAGRESAASRAAGPFDGGQPEGDPRDLVIAEPSMRKVFQIAGRVGKSTTSVLITGETGTGKEVVAETIHRASARASGRFVGLNCASLPEGVLESELFGHEKGAFSGADRRKIGYFESAKGGTLLLDEIGEMTPTTQVKLLRVLETRTITRLGGTQEIPVDVRILSATHRDLSAEIKAGRFREDLYYRIATFTIHVPPLRERPTEIRLLADLFLQQFASRLDEAPPVLSPKAEVLLVGHPWPGNVRELRNAIEHALVLAEHGVVLPEHLPESMRGARGATVGALRTEVASVERRNIEAALAAEAGNQTRAARRLGISRRALIYKLAKYGLKG